MPRPLDDRVQRALARTLLHNGMMQEPPAREPSRALPQDPPDGESGGDTSPSPTVEPLAERPANTGRRETEMSRKRVWPAILVTAIITVPVTVLGTVLFIIHRSWLASNWFWVLLVMFNLFCLAWAVVTTVLWLRARKRPPVARVAAAAA